MKKKAKEYIESGLSVIPISEGKNPPRGFQWSRFRKEVMTDEEIERNKFTNIAAVCGYNNVLCIDIDCKNEKEIYKSYAFLVKQENPELFDKLVIQCTPSGGYHFIYKCDKMYGNQKLASKTGNRVIIETRGEGGYFLIDPSKGYKTLYGSLTNIQTITEAEQEFLFKSAKLFNEKGYKQVSNTGLSPLDEYDEQSTPEQIVNLLTEAGWTVSYNQGEAYFLKRPGKTDRGISATYNYIPNKLYVFSTSTEFESEHVYKPSAVYTMLEYNGDFSACARSLARGGLGTMPKKKAVTVHVSEFEKKINRMCKSGTPVAADTGLPVDYFLKIFKGYLYVCGGRPGHGKSTFHDYLMVQLAKRHGWRFLCFSPESAPIEQHFQLLSEIYIGKPMFGEYGGFNNEEMRKAMDFVDRYFIFIPDEYLEKADLDWILRQAELTMETEKIDGLLIDPFNELEEHMPKDITKTDYIGQVLKKSRHFARIHNLAFWMLAHPKKPGFETERMPKLYDLADSAHWKNKADVGYTVYRNQYDDTIISLQKSRFKWLSKIGNCKLKYSKYQARYYSPYQESEDGLS